MAGAEQNEPKGGTGAQLAKSAALHLMQVLGAATVYLGRTTLDLIDAIRRALLLRNRKKFPERAAKIDSTVASLRDRKAQRWSSWTTVAAGRRMEVRAAALAIVVAAVFVTHAWLNRGKSSREQVAYQARTAYGPSSRSPQGAASIAAPSAAPTVNQTLLDAENFARYRKQAAPGQWIVYGVEPVESARAKLDEAQAQKKSAQAAWLPAWNKYNASFAKVSSDNVRRESLYQQHASQDAFHEADRIIKADQAVADADRAAENAAQRERWAKEAACEAAQAELNDAEHPVVKPVLERGDLNQWDDFKVMSPVVIKDGSRYRMWYVGCHFIGDEYTCGIGHAQSRDGVGWEKSPGPVLSIADATSQYLHSISVAHVGHEYMLWYAIDSSSPPGNECATLNLATSEDGLFWKPYGLVLSANCQNTAHLWQSAFYDGKTIHLWYADYDSSANGSLMHLTSTDGRKWQKAGATDIGTLGMDPRRLWVMPDDSAGYRALFAAHDQKGYFGMLQSADGNGWKITGNAPKLNNLFSSGADGVPEAPVAILEGAGTWMWFAVPTRDGSERIALAFQKGATP
jgi:hypothetical protein